MLKRLRQAMTTGEYLLIYTAKDNPSSFCYGRILAVDEDYVALYLISPEGAYDGILVKETGSVQRIESGGQYDAKMKKLMQGEQLPDWPWETRSGSIAAQLLSMAAERRNVVSIEFWDSGLDNDIGLVKAVDEETATVTLMDAYGYPDGESLFRLDSVTQIACDGRDERNYWRLWQINGGQ